MSCPSHCWPFHQKKSLQAFCFEWHGWVVTYIVSTNHLPALLPQLIRRCDHIRRVVIYWEALLLVRDSLCGRCRCCRNDRPIDLEASILSCSHHCTRKVPFIVDRVVVGTCPARAATCARAVARLCRAGPGRCVTWCVICVSCNTRLARLWLRCIFHIRSCICWLVDVSLKCGQPWTRWRQGSVEGRALADE